ncbi:MAG: glutaminase [Pseudomonadota bacterium]
MRAEVSETIAGTDFDALLARIAEDVRPLVSQGKVASYIPRLAQVPVERFGMAVATLDGRRFSIGDAATPFSIQSISKVFSLSMALDALGGDLWQRVGREPSGSPYNSLVQLEDECGIPRNPFINAGALVVADVVLSKRRDGLDALLAFIRERAGNPDIGVDSDVAESEALAGFRNAALTNFIRSFGNIEQPVEDVLDFYFRQCAIAMSCEDLALAFLHQADGGRCRRTGVQVISPVRARRINSLMLTCGTYDAAGDFAFHVGLPAKSGVGGGIAAVVPGALALAVWSPGLDERGNSLAGTAALARFTELTGWSIF